MTRTRAMSRAPVWSALAVSLATTFASAAHGGQRRIAPDYPAIVVGSGYGGSVAALSLGTAGVDTLVLERGRNWTVRDPRTNTTFATLDTVTAPGGDGRSTWMNDKCVGNIYLTFAGPFPCPRSTGILEEIDDAPAAHRDASPALRMNGVHAWVAAGVGGGSLVNNGVTFAPTKRGWDVAFPPATLPFMQDVWADLEARYFGRALARLAPVAIPADVLASDPYLGTRLLDGFAAAAGYPEENAADPSARTFGRTLVPVLVDWAAVRGELSGRRIPAITEGEVWWGDNSGAKRSLDNPDGYLGRAVSTGHVTVKPLSTVTAVSFDRLTRLYDVKVTRTDLDYRTLETRTFTTRRLFLAAGSLGTTKLLVRARETGDLPRLNAFVGTTWNTNGDMAAFRFASSSFLPQGGPATVKITDFRQPDNPVVIELGAQRVPSFFALSATLRPFFGALFTIGFGVPSGTGVFHYEGASDTIVLDWPSDGAANVYSRVTEILTDPALPGVPFVLPMAQAQQTTVHPLGGVPLGLATDLHCRLRGYRGLYAVDGSIVPGAAAAANPSLLIAALAERCMDHVTRHISEDEEPNESGEED